MNDLIEMVKNLSPYTSVANTIVTAILGSLFLRSDTRCAELEKLKVTMIGKKAEQLLDLNLLTYSDFIKASNLEKIAEYLDQHVEMNTIEINYSEYDVDWFMKFYEAASTVSNEQIQEIWAQILISELKSPKSISYKTLDILRNISSKEAHLLKKLLSKSIWINKHCFIMSDKQFLMENNISYEELLILEDYGLLKLPIGLNIDITIEKNEVIYLGFSNNKRVRVENLESYQQILTIGQYPFTIFGQELIPIVKSYTNDETLRLFKEILEINNPKLQFSIVPMITVEVLHK